MRVRHGPGRELGERHAPISGVRVGRLAADRCQLVGQLARAKRAIPAQHRPLAGQRAQIARGLVPERRVVVGRRQPDLEHVTDLRQIGVVTHGQRPDLAAHLAGIDIEQGDDPEAMVGEDVRGGDRRAEVAGAEQRDVVLARRVQDLADLIDQRVDVVTDPALAELAEA